MDPLAYLAEFEDRITHFEQRDPQPGVVEPWPEWVSARVREIFERQGIHSLWGHQAEALNLLHSGQNVVVATGTSSGKSLIYQVHALEALAAGRTGSALHGHRRPTVLYLSPTKALAADQWSRLPKNVPWLRAATVDGDNTAEERQWARDHANLVLANPDVLHHSMLPRHRNWSRFLSGLTLVIIDEAHHYRGVFGSHVSQVLRRLRRLCAEYGAAPLFVLSSATMAEPEQSARNLIGLDVAAVTDDGSERGAFSITFWQPPVLPGLSGQENQVRRSPMREAGDLLASLVAAKQQTLVFVNSRAGAERIARLAREHLSDTHPDAETLIAAYRGGYLPEERRDLEEGLRTGRIRGVVSTSALELGIDVSGLDVVVTVGFPGTRAAMWQRFGRAGRSGADGLGILIARAEPLDAHIVEHPESVLSAPTEAIVFDPNNPYVLGPHLAAAAQEIPITEADFGLFGPRAREGVKALTAAGLLRARSNGWYWTSPERASDLADLRSSGGHEIQIVEFDTGRVVGTVDASSADRDVHTDAVYVHRGEDFVITDYQPQDRIAFARKAEVSHSTQAHGDTSISVIHENEQRLWADATISWGPVKVTNQITGFDVHDRESGRSLGEQPLDLAKRSYDSVSVWWTLPAIEVSQLLDESRVAGAAHAAEHAAIGLLPLFAECDRWDIGGVSTTHHPDTGRLTVFVHDGYPGGAGFSERGFAVMRSWLQATLETIRDCECFDGCPRCVVSPKCGNRNEPLDKDGAVVLLTALLAGAPAQST